MAKVEIEIDDEVLEAIERQGYRITKLSKPIDGEMYLSSKNIVCSWLCTETNFVWPIVEPKPDDSISFPDWVPKRFNFVTVDRDGTVEIYADEPVSQDGGFWWHSSCDELNLTDSGFDTFWVPQPPNGDWTKAKWRRRDD